MKLLMHLCCANCGLYPIKTLTEKGIDITGLWFNPNIHPYTEYSLRLDAVRQLQKLRTLNIEYIDFYGLKDFIEQTGNGGENRCRICYTMRLDKTAMRAKEMGVDGFTTSLLVSPYQKHNVIIEVGREIEKKYSVEFFSEDFRPGWKEGIRMSRELGLYRQKYCGCIYSEMERYAKKIQNSKWKI
ncbi:MAG: epoxyqueuosine reductase QueH [Nitrospirae bacterium]|nr:MAG: epoxyqueuosine reductase QueH [Nitrospirota bacterium]